MNTLKTLDELHLHQNHMIHYAVGCYPHKHCQVLQETYERKPFYPRR
jgi:hypothetical protein